MYDITNLYEAKSLQNAITLLKEHPEALVIAGGSDLLVKVREGTLAGREFVSIFKLDELRGVSLDPDGTLRILPLTSFSHITKNPLIQKHINVLGEAADQVGGPQIRNIGTIGGNICNGVTSADCASTLFAYDATVELTGSEGVRLLPIKDFYIAPGEVALKPTEILTAILIKPESYEGYFGHYIKHAVRNAMDIAILACSCNVKLSADKKTVMDMRLAFGVAGPVPVRAAAVEAAVKGKSVSEELLETAGKVALTEANPRTDRHAKREFRLHLMGELTKRAMKKSIELAGGNI